MARVQSYAGPEAETDYFQVSRSFLFLQGIASPFFVPLADTLRKQGYGVHKIAFCGGDRLFWRGHCDDFRSPFEEWSDYLRAYLRAKRITDIVLFGDMRPIHRVAISIARKANIQVHVFEEGYMRPNWITVDRGGANANSSFEMPMIPVFTGAELDTSGEHKRSTDQPFKLRTSKRARAIWDVAYHAGNIACAPFFPFYRHHRPQPVAAEAVGWVRRLTRLVVQRGRAERDCTAAQQRHPDFYFVPLQLNSDSQIRSHSPFGTIDGFLAKTLASFAENAPAETGLIIKSHPLDNGTVDWRASIERLSAKLGISERVTFIDGGDTNALIQACKGVVLVNSTVGLTAVMRGTATIALGTALYDRPGITHQGPLDDFWVAPTAPDAEEVTRYTDAIVEQTQVYGSYFDREHFPQIAQGVAECMLSRPASAAVALPASTLDIEPVSEPAYLVAAE